MFARRAFIASLTASVVFWLLSFSSQSALAEEPIQRAFGQTLGAVFDPATSTQSSGHTDDAVFWYPDPAKIPELTEFSVSVAPITYRIYGIYATGEASNKSACIDSVHGLFAIVAKKYNGEQYGGDMRQVKGEEAYFLTQSKTHRMIHVGCEDVDGKVKLEMGYIDETIRDESRLAELASPVTVCLATSIQGFENISSLISAIWTEHGHSPPFFGSGVISQPETLFRKSSKTGTEGRRRKTSRLAAMIIPCFASCCPKCPHSKYWCS